MGLGAAVRTALDAFMSRSSGDDVLVTLDADDTHDPEVIKKLLEEIGRGAQVVTASRFQPGGKEVGVSFMRRVFSRGARVFMSIVAPVPGAKDYTCGFRAYSRPALARAKEIFGDGLVESDHFSCMSELLVKLAATGAKISEVPFVLRYDRKQGPSKMRFSATIPGYISLISMSRGARRRVKMHDKGGV
jgi:dolichol-phosphate mannosyltransferase